MPHSTMRDGILIVPRGGSGLRRDLAHRAMRDQTLAYVGRFDEVLPRLKV